MNLLVTGATCLVGDHQVMRRVSIEYAAGASLCDFNGGLFEAPLIAPRVGNAK